MPSLIRSFLNFYRVCPSLFLPGVLKYVVDFLFITFFLHFFLSWTYSLLISSSSVSTSTLSNHVILGVPTGLFPSTFKLHTFIHPVLITCPYHLSLPLLMTVVIGSTPTSLLNYSLIRLSFK